MKITVVTIIIIIIIITYIENTHYNVVSIRVYVHVYTFP
jgi:hypothetical protein